MENRIAELKHNLGADDFCLREFFATEAAFRSILLLFNLLAEFQRASGLRTYRQPATLRTQVFLCGALLGRAGHRLVTRSESVDPDSLTNSGVRRDQPARFSFFRPQRTEPTSTS